MFYCRQEGYENASLCEDVACDYRTTMLEEYDRTKRLLCARLFNWCRQRCSSPCGSRYGVLCDEEIERLRDRGIAVEDVLANFKKVHRVIFLEAARRKRMRKK